jgi:hypothetical protein
MGGSVTLNTLGGLAARRIFASVVTHEASQAFTTTVEAVYRRLRGQQITWDAFLDELIARLSDPRGVVVASLMGVVHAGAQYHYGAPREIQLNAPKGRSSEIDVLRTRTVIEEKTLEIERGKDPNTGHYKPGQTPAEVIEKQLVKKTITRLALLGIRSRETRPEDLAATSTRPQPKGTPEVPPIGEVRAAAEGRKYQFWIAHDSPELRLTVEAGLQRLRGLYPGWEFTAVFGKE